jgi:signal transduction histidine kinase
VWGKVEMRFAARRLLTGFDDPDMERRFAEANLDETLPFMRWAVAFGTLLYALFGILDYAAFPEDYGKLWLIRYGIVCPILALVLVFSFTEPFRRVAPMLMPTGVCVAGLGIVAMTAIEGIAGIETYYAGIIITMIFCATLAGVRFASASLVCLLLTLAYFISATLINPLPRAVLVNNMFFLTVTLAFGVFSALAQDFYVRRNFITAEALREEKGRAETLLDRARAGSRAKSEFLAVMSHELRTPLNAIIGFSDMMRQQIFGPIGSQRYVAYAEDIRKSGEHLLGIIDGILDLSMAESGTLSLRSEPVDLLAVLDEVTARLREQARGKGVRLRFDCELPELRVMADPRLLRQVGLNLVSNAVKFTQTGGAVTIGVRVEETGEALLSIADSGIGIAAADLDRLEEPFVQAESAFARGHGGMGLGLPLTKKIMELHGGGLDIASELGVGTRVVARFPAARVLSLPGGHRARGAA